eukprot:COSAG02_NODE_81_length_39811_cov_51.728898_2_plen_57_part_00
MQVGTVPSSPLPHCALERLSGTGLHKPLKPTKHASLTAGVAKLPGSRAALPALNIA